MPLRISADRVVLYGITLFAFGALPALLGHPGDWQRFWAGGATVGTSALFNEGEHLAFQAARGIGTGIWTYPPAFAWAFLPAAHLTISAGYAINFVFMLILVALCGWIVAGIFGFHHRFGVIAALAWQPAIYSGDVGQISAVWLFLIALAMAGAVQGSSLIVGLARRDYAPEADDCSSVCRAASRAQAVASLRDRGTLCRRVVLGECSGDSGRVGVDTSLPRRYADSPRRRHGGGL